jgi:hypothetical protein
MASIIARLVSFPDLLNLELNVAKKEISATPVQSNAVIEKELRNVSIKNIIELEFRNGGRIREINQLHVDGLITSMKEMGVLRDQVALLGRALEHDRFVFLNNSITNY